MAEGTVGRSHTGVVVVVVPPMVHTHTQVKFMDGDGCCKYAQHFSLSASLVPNVHNWSVWRFHGLLVDTVLSEVFIEIIM